MSKRAEWALMGSLLIDPEAVRSVRRVVAPEDFTSEYWREVYRILLELDDSGLPWDYVTVDWTLEQRQGERKNLGPLVEALNHAATSLHAGHYADLVHRSALKRRFGESGTPKGVLAL